MPQFDYQLILAALVARNLDSDPEDASQKWANRREGASEALAAAYRVLNAQDRTADAVIELYGLQDADPLEILHKVFEDGPLSRKGWIKTEAARSCAMFLTDHGSHRTETFCVFDGAFPVAVELALAGTQVGFACESWRDSDLFTLAAALTNIITDGSGGKIILLPLEELWPGLPSFVALEYNGRATADAVPSGFFAKVISRIYSDKVLVWTSSSLLWQATRDAEQFRDMIVQEKRLHAVIELPFALSASPLNGPALLILGVKNSSRAVRFYDFSDVKLRGDESSSWPIPFDAVKTPQQSGVRDLLTDFSDQTMANDSMSRLIKKLPKLPKPDERWISFEIVNQNGNILGVKRYASSSASLLSRLTSQSEGLPTVQLSEIADITRALMIKSEATGLAFMEVALGDIDRFGFVFNAKKQIRTQTDRDIRRARQATLEDEDIILSVKGGAGTIGFVLDPEGDMIAGQQFVIIRIKTEYRVEFPPSYVFRYLKSSVMQDYLQSRKLGEKLPILKMSDIDAIPIIKPTEEFLQKDKDRHTAQLRYCGELFELEKKIRDCELDLKIFEPEEERT